MQGFFRFFAQNLYQLCAPLKSFILGSILFNLLLGALVLPLYERNIQNYFISVHLRDDYLKLRQKKGSGDRESNSLIVSHGYSLVAPDIAPVLQSLFAVIYAFAIRTDVIEEFVTGRFARVLTMNSIEIFQNRQPGMAYLTFLLSAFVFLSYYVIVKSEYESLVDDKKTRLIILIVQSALALILPIGYSFALLIFELYDFGDYVLSTTVFREQRLKRAISKMNIEAKAYNATVNEGKKKKAEPQKKGYAGHKKEKK